MILVDVIGGNTNCWAGTLGRHFFRTAQRGAFFTILLLTAFLANGMVRAEIGGVVRGLVTDELTGRPITNADVAIITLDRITRTTRSDAGGVFEFAAVPEGLVVVRVVRDGYFDAEEPEARVVLDRVTRADFQLVRRAQAVEEIVVTAKAAGAAGLGSVTATRLSREEIRRAAGTAGDIFRGLDALPGVASTGEFSNFTVRGSGPRDNLILVDEFEFDKVVHFDRSLGQEEDIGGGGRFSIFAPNLIGGAEFQPGGWSASEGGRNGSLLRLSIAQGNPDTPSVSAQLDVAGGELTYDGPSYVLDNTSVILSARYFDFGRLFRTIGQNDIGDPEFSDVIFKSVTDISDNHRVSLLALYSPEDFTRDTDNVLESKDFEDAALFASEQDSMLLGATWRWLVGAEGQLSNRFFLRDSDKTSLQGEAFPDRAGPNPTAATVPVRTNIVSLTEAEREMGWRGDYTTPTPWGDLAVGARYTRVQLDLATRLAGDWIRYVYDRDDFRPNAAQKFVVLTPTRFNAAFRAREARTAVYADHTFYVGDISIRPGARLDRDGLSDQSLWSPRLALGWMLSPATKLAATAGVYYQAPRFLDIAADPTNARLKNERSDQISLGLEHELGSSLSLETEVYYRKLEDLVVSGDKTSGTALNSGDGHSAGLDLGLTRRLIDDWSGSLAYSYSRTRRDDNRGEGPYDADFHRPHVFTLALAWQPNDVWAFAGKWKFASGRPTDAFVVNSNIFNDPTFVRFSKEIVANNTLRLRDFHALNLRVDYRRRFGDVSVIAFADIINVYGRKNIDSVEFNERRGTNVTGDLNVFPQVGLKFEF